MRNEKGQFKKGIVSPKKGETLTDKGQLCASCGKDKLVTDFGKNKNRFNGLHVYCKLCCKSKRQTYKDTHKQYMKDYYQQNKKSLLEQNQNRYFENKEQYLLKQKNYYRLNKEQINKTNITWAEKNRKKSNQIKERWKQKNPWHGAYYTAVRRTRLLKQTPYWANIERIKDIYKNCPDGMEVDHITPVSKGGLHCALNLQYLTSEQNRRKYNKLTASLFN